MKSSFLKFCAAAALLCAAPLFSWAAPAPVAAGDTSSFFTLTPEFDQTLQQLSSDNFKDRKSATRQLELMLAQLSSRFVLTNDAEAQGHIAEIMRFNTGLSQWLTSVLQLAPDPRKEALKWGLQAEHIALVAGAYSPLPQERMKAAAGLARINDREAGPILAKLLGDMDRDVHLAAMDDLWDLPQSPEVVDALWDRAIVSLMDQMRPRGAVMLGANAAVMFHGEPLRPVYSDSGLLLRAQDSEVAARLLVHGNSPLVKDKIIAILKEELSSPPGTRVTVFQPYSSGQIFETLVLAFKSNQTIALMYQLATQQITAPPNMVFGARQFRWDPRIAAISDVVEMTAQDPSDYHLKKTQIFPGSMVMVTEDEEKDAVQKLTAWWALHGKTYEGDTASTQPATAP
jgi:hypothetical protein